MIGVLFLLSGVIKESTEKVRRTIRERSDTAQTSEISLRGKAAGVWLMNQASQYIQYIRKESEMDGRVYTTDDDKNRISHTYHPWRLHLKYRRCSDRGSFLATDCQHEPR